MIFLSFFSDWRFLLFFDWIEIDAKRISNKMEFEIFNLGPTQSLQGLSRSRRAQNWMNCISFSHQICQYYSLMKLNFLRKSINKVSTATQRLSCAQGGSLGHRALFIDLLRKFSFIRLYYWHGLVWNRNF